jgi:hypothetical protein
MNTLQSVFREGQAQVTCLIFSGGLPGRMTVTRSKQPFEMLHYWVAK